MMMVLFISLFCYMFFIRYSFTVYISFAVGHGFKLAPVVGKILSELALDLPPSYDLLSFKLDRFTTSSTHN